MENKKSLGEYIAQRRRALGMTQRQFAEKLYVTDSARLKMGAWSELPRHHAAARYMRDTRHLRARAADRRARIRRHGARRRWHGGIFGLVRGWKFGQIACYSLAAVVCFIADLASDGALSWFWVVLASLLTAASLTLTPRSLPSAWAGSGRPELLLWP